MRVVLDTNVLVAALLNPDRGPARALNMVLNGELRLLYDNRILFEYQDVLSRERFGFPVEDVHPLLDFIEQAGEYISATPVEEALEDTDDTPFFEVAISGRADYLVTCNKRHFPKEPRVVTPTELLQSVRRDRKAQE